MQVVIFGASGATGHRLVAQALTEGHDVTAFVRSASKLETRHDRLRIVEGDAADRASVERAVAGRDAVLSALGVSVPLKRDPAVVEGVRNIVGAMEDTGTSRLVYLSFLGVREARDQLGFPFKHIAGWVIRHEIADHEVKEAIIRDSNLNWTIVRAHKLTSGSAAHAYRSGERLRPRGLVPTLSRADVAAFMLQEMRDVQYSRRAVSLMQ